MWSNENNSSDRKINICHRVNDCRSAKVKWKASINEKQWELHFLNVERWTKSALNRFTDFAAPSGTQLTFIRSLIQSIIDVIQLPVNLADGIDGQTDSRHSTLIAAAQIYYYVMHNPSQSLATTMRTCDSTVRAATPFCLFFKHFLNKIVLFFLWIHSPRTK